MVNGLSGFLPVVGSSDSESEESVAGSSLPGLPGLETGFLPGLETGFLPFDGLFFDGFGFLPFGFGLVPLDGSFGSTGS